MVMKNKKSIVLVLLSIIFLFSLSITGCGGSSESKNEKLNWSVTVLGTEVKSVLEATDDVRQYDGSIAKVNHKNVPSNGNIFLLVQLDLKKNIAGNHPFKWSSFELKNKDDAKFKRTNDIFLADYKYKRIPATDLKLDAQGWICFEVPNNAKPEDLKIIYRESEKQNIIPLKK